MHSLMFAAYARICHMYSGVNLTYVASMVYVDKRFRDVADFFAAIDPEALPWMRIDDDQVNSLV